MNGPFQYAYKPELYHKTQQFPNFLGVAKKVVEEIE